MKRVRVELRYRGHTGRYLGAYRILGGWGYNIDLGRYFIAVRRPSKAKWRPINMTWRSYLRGA